MVTTQLHGPRASDYEGNHIPDDPAGYNRDMVTVHHIYQGRAYLIRGKHRRLGKACRECPRLCNAALEEWWTAYRQVGVVRGGHSGQARAPQR